ncbi:hypothetical protein METBIDRAFT_36251 [Metschnikowia bicuspidata var. bicuspidata NRRL YB-4993]|uniref:Uncharacterized protein n=1 Tax=Metschnikowia bicuspidata var. bicuspidata NRRL YB-4993 TaxID=869754 RepID=A0A1A0HHA8_9ASCO|nr:hypothetical protein METBIDRAFT_36251 [Metschnikowia bicuspidata var. bicuspidata NRRL YB-4993]OBA23386.1 hypothetical protein METBIDRAFT_36251 [Metschnikowia bicuspidata var. bicuspidata NRRL YB-4993]
MPGNIVRALGWDIGYEQQFLAVNPLGDEITLYQTHHEIEGIESNELLKMHSHTGIEHIQCMAYLKARVGWTGVGTMDGNAHIFDITRDSSSSVQLKTKHNRPCNSLSFNDQLLVAASFDKSRQDNSLQVWDLTKHALVFLAADDDEGARAIRPQAGYLANEATLSTLFNSSDPSGMLLMAGGYKLLREFDLRDLSPTPIYQVATKSTMKLAQDTFQLQMFSSMSEDGSVSIWDRRKLVSTGKGSMSSESPVLLFPKLMSDNLRRGAASCFRYSTIRRGEFAAVFNGDLIRRWNTGVVPKNNSMALPTLTSNTDVVSGLKQQSMQLYNPREDLLFVAMVLDCKTDLPRVISFDYSPDTSSHTSTNFVCMREKGLVFRMPVAESVEALDFNSCNEFSVAGPEGTLTRFLDSPFTEPLSSVRPVEAPSAYAERNFSDQKRAEEEDVYIPLRRILDLSDVLRNDICCAIRQRVECGYGVDSERNFQVLENTEGAGASLLLRNTWKWITLAKKSLEKGTMVKEGADLGYVGVLAMWKGVEELRGQNRVRQNKPISEDMFANAVRVIAASKGEKSSGISVLHTSERPLQRKLSLIVSGWYLASHEFDEKLNVLVKDGQIEKAAGWAVFHGDVSRAIEILSASKKERLQLMSTAVAGYMAYKDSNINLPWNDQCRKLSLELDNLYLRAIFAFIADNDWWDVLDEHSLPLRERLGIAIRFLSDKDLNVYLNRVADSVVTKGELEGLILTGLTPRGIDLLQSYVDRTSDVQTAALIAQFAVPRYFKDERVDHWIDCYRELLNSWGYFKQRAKFDVARTKSSRNSSDVVTIRPAPRQVYLQCKLCKKNMSSNSSKNAKSATNNSILMKQFNHRLSLKGTNNYFNLCPHCGSQLPRCAICLLTLGGSTALVADSKSTDTNGSSVHVDFDNKFSFCLSCSHGYHAHHAEEWFSKHYICPVPDCNCRCNDK